MSQSSSARAVITDARKRFEAAGLVDAAADARLLVCHFAELTTTQLVTDGDADLPLDLLEAIERAVRRRLDREPVFRIIGRRAFYGLTLALSAETLEPRPDTEILVDAVLPHLQALEQTNGPVSILDLGTGTGAIALALLEQTKQTRAVGVDVSLDALHTALCNASENGLSDRFETRAGSWFDAVQGKFHLIVSNPPYIPRPVMETLEPEVLKHDPPRALDGGADGLDAYRAIAKDAGQHLADGGLIGLEIGYDQRQTVTQIFEEKGFSLLDARCDLGGRDRVLLFVAGA